MQAFVLQMTSTPIVQDNMAFVETSLAQFQDQNGPFRSPSIVVLPECFARFGGRDNSNLAIAESIGDGPIQSQLSDIARKYNIYLVAGSFPTVSQVENKFQATCLIFSPTGELIADYQKIHLFDVDVADNTGSYRESASTEAGNKVICFDTEWGKIGVAICYDLRFPGLFRVLREQGADAIVLPSAFTERTGKAHWLPLLQARAIENQLFMIASNQNGVHQNGRETYGHSMIISPWGEVLANAKRENGLTWAELDKASLDKIRTDMPVRSHNQFKCHLISK